LRRTIQPPELAPIPLRPSTELPTKAIEDIIFARSSTRQYDPQQSITLEAFSTVLECSSRGVAADALAPDAPPLHDNYLIVNGVTGLEPGVYLHRVPESAVELRRAGDFRQQAMRLAAFQPYAADSHVNSYYVAVLEPVLERYGNRGYGLAQLEAALYAGRLHLAAHAVGLRAVGSTSLDDEVVEFLSPRAAGASYLFVTVFGLRRRRQA